MTVIERFAQMEEERQKPSVSKGLQILRKTSIDAAIGIGAARALFNTQQRPSSLADNTNENSIAIEKIDQAIKLLNEAEGMFGQSNNW